MVVVAVVSGLLAVVTVALFAPAIVAAGTAAGTGSAALGLLAFLAFAAASAVLAVIDLRTSRLPNRIVLPALAGGIALLGASSSLSGDWGQLARAGTGMGALFVVYYLTAALSGGMGFGDVKLAAVIGLHLAWLGWAQLAIGVLSAFLLGGLVAVVLIALRRAGPRTAIPFGPWMLAGAWLGVIVGAVL